MPPSNPPSKRAHSPDFLDVTPRKRVRIRKGEMKTVTDSDKKDEVHGRSDTIQINRGISGRDSRSLTIEELWDRMLSDDNKDKVRGRPDTTENNGGDH